MSNTPNRYANLTAEQFSEYVHSIAQSKGVDWLLSLGDVYSIVAEELNNEVLEAWERDNPPVRCIRVEYDRAYYGGDYSGVGQFAYVPRSVVDKHPSVEDAFRTHTGINPTHIIHYTLDEEFTPEGEPIED